MVAAVRDLSRRETLRYVNPGVQVVQWHMPFLLSEEAADPGLTQVYNELMTAGGHGNTYSLRVPRGLPHRTFGECQTDRKSTRLNSSHANISYAVFCLKKKNK